MSPVVFLVVVLGVSISAVAVDVLFDSANKPATDDLTPRSAWEPWLSIWQRCSSVALTGGRATGRVIGHGADVLARAVAAAGRGAGRVAARGVRNLHATAELFTSHALARASNVAQRRAIIRSTRQARAQKQAEADARLFAERQFIRVQAARKKAARARAAQAEADTAAQAAARIDAVRLEEERRHAASKAAEARRLAEAAARARRADLAAEARRQAEAPTEPIRIDTSPPVAAVPAATPRVGPTTGPRTKPVPAIRPRIKRRQTRSRRREASATSDGIAARAAPAAVEHPIRRPGVPVPLQVPTATRLKAAAGLVVMSTMLGLAAAALIAMTALAALQALESV